MRKTRAGKSRDYHDVIVFEKLRFQNVFHAQEKAKPTFLNSSGLKSAFIKLRFRDKLVWTADLTVEIKLRFRDKLVWTAGLTVEIKLRFQISPAQCGRSLRTLIKAKAPSTRVRIFLNPQLFLSGLKNFPVYT